MAARVFLGLFSRASGPYSVSRANLWGRTYYSSEKVKVVAKEKFEKIQDLSFEQFKKTKVKSFEEFQSPEIKEFFNNDKEKIAQAYEDYCVCKFTRYQLAKHGGNPATMI